MTNLQHNPVNVFLEGRPMKLNRNNSKGNIYRIAAPAHFMLSGDCIGLTHYYTIHL